MAVNLLLYWLSADLPPTVSSTWLVPGRWGPMSEATGNHLIFEPIRFEYGPTFDINWHQRLPEFSAAANGVSLLMPYVEPYVVRSIRMASGALPEPLRTEAQTYVRQEGQHHAQHRRFNDHLVEQVPVLDWSESLMAKVYGWLGNRKSLEFNVAFAAGFETVAYAAARWTADNHDTVMSGADPEPARLFLWHLAEEVEHKNVAIDVYRAMGGRKRTYAVAMLLSAVLLAFFSLMNTTVILMKTRRFFNPLAHLRLFGWTISFLFELLPAMAVSALPGHHPSDLADPMLFELWLKENRTNQQASVPPSEEPSEERSEESSEEASSASAV